MTSRMTKTFSPEVRERAVRMVLEHEAEPTLWALQKRYRSATRATAGLHQGDSKATAGGQQESQKIAYMDQCTFGAVRTS